MKHEGLASFPHILIEADVLFHCYGIAYEAAKEPVSVSVAVPEPEPIVVPEPVVVPEPEPIVVPEPVVVPEPALPTLEEMTAKLIAENSKAVLVTKAEQAGIDTSGTKTELAARLASHLIGV
jgi:nucleotide-binding universal stress UspA family protein